MAALRSPAVRLLRAPILAASLLLAGVAGAVDPAPSAAEASDQSPEAQLEAAVAAYLSGEVAEARRRFGALAAREEPFAVVGEALVYLGELALQVGATSEAEAYFERVLRQRPDWRVSAYDHPMDVVGLFELVRDRLERQAPPPPEPRRIPAATFAPFGVPQLSQGRKGAGAAFAVTQILAAGATLPVALEIARLDRRVSTFTPDLTDADRQRLTRRARVLRDGVSFPLAGAFYALWIASAAEGAVWWRRSEAARMEGGSARMGPPALQLAPVVAPSEGGALLLGLGGRW